MAKDYAVAQPVDQYGNQVQPEQAAAVPALRNDTSGALVSSIIALDNRATVIEVVTGGGAVALKWFGSVIGANPNPSVTATAYDNGVPSNWIRRFVIPQSVAGISNIGSVVGGRGAQNGLYTQVAVIPLQASAPTSIFVSQY